MSDFRDTEGRIDEALEAGDVETLDRLAKGDPHYLGTSHFLYAIGCLPLATVKWLIQQGAPVNIEVDHGFPALHTAVDREVPDRLAVMRALVNAGADVNERGMNDWTPLHRAAVRDDVKMVELLLELGADPTLKTGIDNFATAEEEARSFGKTRAAETIRTWVAQNQSTD